MTQVKDAIDNVPVSPALWACCQLANINRLQAIAVVASADKNVILGYEDSLALLAVQCEFLGLGKIEVVERSLLTGTGRFRDSEFLGSEAASQRSVGPKRRKLNSDGQSAVLRSAKEVDNVSAHHSVPQSPYI